MSTIAALLTLASGLASAIGSEEDDKNKEEYNAKLKAWQEHNERIDAINRARAYRQKRRAIMGNAVGSNIPVMPVKPLEERPKSEVMIEPGKSKWTDIAQTLGTVSSMMGPINTIGKNLGIDSVSDIPIVGNISDAIGDYVDDAARKYYTSWSAPDIGREYSTYNYENRYNPSRRYLSDY